MNPVQACMSLQKKHTAFTWRTRQTDLSIPRQSTLRVKTGAPSSTATTPHNHTAQATKFFQIRLKSVYSNRLDRIGELRGPDQIFINNRIQNLEFIKLKHSDKREEDEDEENRIDEQE